MVIKFKGTKDEVMDLREIIIALHKSTYPTDSQNALIERLLVAMEEKL